MVINVVLWPLSYWGLVRRRTTSRMNGGYQSEGTTNTTDLNQVARSLENAENGRGGGFEVTENLKLTPAMMAIPIIVYKKPGGRPVMTAVIPTTSGQLSQPPQPPQQPQQQQDQSATTGTRPDGDQPVVLAMPRPRRFEYSDGRDTQTDVLNRMSANLSIICSTPSAPSNTSPRHGRSHSSTTTGSMLSSSNMSFIPCTSSGQEMTEIETRRRSVSGLFSVLTSLQTITPSTIAANSGSGSGSGTGEQTAVAAVKDVGAGGYPSCVSSVAFPESHQRSYSAGQASNATNHSFAPHSEYLATHESAPTSAPPPVVFSQPAIASLPAPSSLGTPSVTSSKTSSPYLSPLGSVAVSVVEESDDLPSQSHHQHQQDHQQVQEVQAQEEFNNGDEECAICLSDFEDGDELRHLYCNHLFHRNCVDRWLVKNAFCPKCKRGI
ncbi:hypothetical protein BGZ47_010331 [Haplosporangium gracile]|nr:hypothetical protein BGZ47_010331 [Haplosporangium gracile]